MSNQSDRVPRDLPTLPDDLNRTGPKPRPRGNMYERAERRYYEELAAMEAAAAAGAPADPAPPPALDPFPTEQAITPAVAVVPIEEGSRGAADVITEELPSEEAVAPADHLPVASKVVPLEPAKTVDAIAIARAVTSPRALRPLVVMATILLVGAVAATFAIRTALQPAEDDAAPIAARETTATATAPAPAPAPAPVARAAAVNTPAAAAAATPKVRDVARPTEAAPAPPVATAGQIRITSNPAGARVTVNGIGWGQTPLTIRALPFGTKTVRLTRDGYVSMERSVSLSGRDPAATLNVTMQKR